MRVLELFAGGGGGVLASRMLGHRVVCAVERDPYCREILMRRQEDGELDPFPIWDDVRTFDGRLWRGLVDVVSGGFPCQPFSVAGKQRGEADERNMWPEMRRIIGEVGPRYVFGENVPGLVRQYLPRVLGDLAELGFDAEWGVLGADDVGAPHRRKRLWVLATHPHRNDVRIEQWGSEPRSEAPESRHDGAQQRMAEAEHPDPDRRRLARERRRRSGATVRDPDRDDVEAVGGVQEQEPEPRGGRPIVGWEIEPDVGRVVDGVAARVDRLRALGNGQVPQCYAEAWRQLWKRLME